MEATSTPVYPSNTRPSYSKGIGDFISRPIVKPTLTQPPLTQFSYQAAIQSQLPSHKFWFYICGF